MQSLAMMVVKWSTELNYNSDDPSSNPAEVYSFFLVRKKEAGVGPL